MKTYSILTFLLLWVSETTYSQYLPKNFIAQDLSHIFINSAMIGFIGDDYSRIDIPYDSFKMSECEKIAGSICGYYALVEYGNEQYSGTFSGRFKEVYWLDEHQIKKRIIETEELKTTLSEYQGRWTFSKGLVKECSWIWPWGKMIPNTPDDFSRFNDYEEWAIQPKYRKNGWENRHNASHNYDISKEDKKIHTKRKREMVGKNKVI